MEHAQASSPRRCTLQEYLALEEPEGPRFELSDGDLLMAPSTTWSHHAIRDRLNALLRAALEPAAIAYVTSDTDFLLGPATVRRPDVAVILAARFRPEFADLVPIPIAPDLVFEIASERDRAAALLLKVKHYLEAGTEAVWLLYPRLGMAHRYWRGAAAPRVFSRTEAIKEPHVLPGLSIALAELLSA
ncbi:MAG: Uma2 family endonuclease [Terriglobales bacterium]